MGIAPNNDDTILARWLSDELSQEEILAFEKDPEFLTYKNIKQATNRLYIEKPDMDTAFDSLMSKRNQPEPKVKKLRSYSWLYAVAAAMIIGFGSILYMNSLSQFNSTTAIAETQKLLLPDGSEVSLNASSTISYDKDRFLKERTLTLDGEAYFKIKKGNSFTVLSENGSVQVLGTAFNVYSRDTNFSVFCDEGRVQVKHKLKTSVLTAGEGAFAKAGSPLSRSIREQSPQWRLGKTNFKKATLNEVIAELERQFPVQINVKNIDLERNYSGFFTHKSIPEALDQICLPMDINYAISGSNILLEGN